MDQNLQSLLNLIQQSSALSDEEKASLLKVVNNADKEFEITTFKLERTEKVKRTTAILLEETIEELEQKRKAVEAQNRELEIESCLERVRTVAMSMNKADDMLGICQTISAQLQSLGVKEIRNVQTAIIYENKGTYLNHEYYAKHDKLLTTEVYYTDHAMSIAFVEQMQKGTGEIFTRSLSGKELKDWYAHQQTTNQFLDVYLETTDSLSYYWCSLGPVALGISTYAPLSEELKNLFIRFRNVFELSYRRFLDIEKAEAQAREAQIQLALERVRARTMAMQKSNELSETAYILSQQFKALGESLIQITIGIINEEEGIIEFWVTDLEGNKNDRMSRAAIDEPTLMRKMYAAWKEQKKSTVVELAGNELSEWVKYRNKISGTTDDNDYSNSRRYASVAFFSKGLISLSTPDPKPKETIQLLERFAGVFDLTYTRFLDLQKAEAQAREAQIEAALERIRSKTIGMHKSTDLLEVISVLSEQFLLLGFKIHSANFNTSYRQKDWDLWLYNPGYQMYPDQIHIPYLDNPFFNRTLESLANGADFTAFVFSKEEKDEFLDHLYATTIAKNASEERKRFSYNAPGFAWSTVYLKNTALTIANYDAEPYTEEQNAILRRFGNVFEQTYTRFLDLQKAEAQAREATLEAALERVRGKAMAMHNTNDLSSTASIIFTELRNLGISPMRCGVGLLNNESRKAQLYSATTSLQGDCLSLVGWVLLSGHPVLENIYDTWLKNEEYYPELSGEQLRSYYQLLLSGLSVPVPPDTGQKQYGTFLPFSVGCLYAWSETPYNDAELKILKRFATIIDLTFRRYIELQKSEASAREAVKQATLDRVRAEIASMRTIGDLDRITPLIWNELTILGIPFIRCGAFIMDDSQQLIHTFLSTPDGKAIAAFHIPYSTPGNIADVLGHWQQKEIYINHWNEVDFKEFADALVRHGALASPEQYLSTIPHGGFYLHFLPFLQGMLYVGNSDQLNEEEIKLIQSVASAFSTAYARYEDFNKLEAAKQTVEKTLVDLRQTQAQLVQSEKMASLGELTAGIAHEIQNPLNFVNNFSEVNKELLAEMNEEIEKGNYEEVKSLAKDVTDNEEKINHHGKRADAIVKGMLQHSRSSSGQKEPTDINALADEYLRLSYHGLRAKDKSFNATMKTDFDKSIGNINIIPQDIGRVILNLITNAFYVVDEKKKTPQPPEGGVQYEPTVTVSTKSVKSPSGDLGVVLTVKDNGNGIPQKVLDKIFQPFFTTKPTGQGTGLGLSLSYDIVKAHGGEIKVESMEGEGTEFKMILPLI